MEYVIRVFLFVAFTVGHCFGANILALTSAPSPSHHIWNRVLMIELAARGHNVTHFGPDIEKTPVPNLTHIQVTGVYENLLEEFDFDSMPDDTMIQINNELFFWVDLQCELILKSKEISILNSLQPGTFDLVIVDITCADCLYPIIEKLGSPPVVATSPFGIFPWISYVTGGYEYSPFVPHYSSADWTDKMTIVERVQNLLINLYVMSYRKFILQPKLQQRVNEFYGDKYTPIAIMEKNISVILSNHYDLFGWAQPLMPNLIPVGGLHVRPPKQLPKDIQKFLDEAPNGAIMLSLGTNIRSDKISKQKLNSIIEALRRIPQRVLWKWESDTLPGKPPNVMIQKWLPQSDILAHKNIVAVVTHGGALSSQEAQARGVPMVVIPFFADQHANANRLSHRGVAIHVKSLTITADKLEAALREIVENPQYRINAKRISDRFRDQLETPLERAVFWTEYVLRHGTAEHMKCQAVNMPFYQTYSLDVIAVLLVMGIFLFKLMVISIRFVWSTCWSSKKIKTA